MQQFMRRFSLFFIIFPLVTAARPASNLPMTASMDPLHTLIFYTSCLIGVIVFAGLISSLFVFRCGRSAKEAHFHKSLTVEIFWTLLPALLFIALVMPSVMVLKRGHTVETCRPMAAPTEPAKLI